jgi:hypothetical protein
MKKFISFLSVVAVCAFATNANAAIYNFGTLTPDGFFDVISGGSVSGGLDYFTFYIAGDATVGAGSYVHIDTDGSDYDTELGIYTGQFGVDPAASQTLISNDDDDWFGLQSELSHGDDIYNYGNGIPLAPGRDGDLGPGWYTIVLGGFNTTYGGTIDNISGGSSSGNFNVWVAHFADAAVPEPGTLTVWALLGLSVAGLRRRKNV